MKLLSFPEDVRERALHQAAEWGITPDMSLEEVIHSIEDNLQEVIDSHERYGVEDAILEGKRMRLLDKRGFHDRRFNCAEIGANIFLFLRSLDHDVGVLRFQEKNNPSPHFAVVSEGNPRMIIDPLWKMYGEAKFMQRAFLYSDNAIDGETLKSTHKKKLYRGEWVLLDEDELLRHIEFINSPAGFFHYYAQGQRIKSIDHGLQLYDWSAQTKEDRLVLRITGKDGLIDAYTFEREYRFDGDLNYEDRHILHLGTNQTHPTLIVYDSAGAQHEIDRYHPRVIAFSDYMELQAMENFDEIRRTSSQGYAQFLNDEHEKSLQKLKDLNEEIAQKDTQCIIDLQLTENHRSLNEEIGAREGLIRYLTNMDTIDQEFFLYGLGFYHSLRRREIPVGKKLNGRIRPQILPVIERYAAVRRNHFAPVVAEFLGSPVVNTLIEQYCDAASLMQSAHEMVVNQ